MRKNTLSSLILFACASFSSICVLASNAMDESEAQQNSRKRPAQVLRGEKDDAKHADAQRKRRRFSALLEAACAKSDDYAPDHHPVVQLAPMQFFAPDLPIFQLPMDKPPVKELPARKRLPAAEKEGLDHLAKWKDTQGIDRYLHALNAVRIFEKILLENQLANQRTRPQVLGWAAMSHFRLGMSALDAETKAHFVISAQLCERFLLARAKPTQNDMGFAATAYFNAAKYGTQEQKLHYFCASANLFDQIVWSDGMHCCVYTSAAHAHLWAARTVTKENKLAFLKTGEKICQHGLEVAPQKASDLHEILSFIHRDLSQYYKG